MRILVFNHNLVEHGNYFRALKFAQLLSLKGHNVSLITSSNRWYKTNKYFIGAVRVIESPSYSIILNNDSGWSPLGLLYRLWVVFKGKYDIVYGFSHKPIDFIPAYVSKMFKGSFYITDWCDWYGKGGMFEHKDNLFRTDLKISKLRRFVFRIFDRIEEYLEELSPRKADFVTVICKALYNRAVSIGIKEDKLLYLFSGANIEDIKPMDKLTARSILNFKSLFKQPIDYENHIFLVYIANYHPDEKLLLKALSFVCSKEKNVTLLVVGPNFYISRSKIRELGLSILDFSSMSYSTSKNLEDIQIVHFGRKPFREINTFLSAGDILLLPMSDIVFNRGRWPNKIGDYLAAGRPIVINNVGDIPGIIRDKKVGYIAEPNAEDFAEKIIQMIQDKNKWEEYGRNARKIAETVLNWEQIGDKLYSKLKERIKNL